MAIKQTKSSSYKRTVSVNSKGLTTVRIYTNYERTRLHIPTPIGSICVDGNVARVLYRVLKKHYEQA